ncbi:MAG: hypothetical protein PUE15_02015 [Prevotella sp.]|nr:hypothetical protein [Prevotella sp.]
MSTSIRIDKNAIETAYSFYHQKERVYAHSNMEWQKDDIEYAISSYVQDMDKTLYGLLSDGHDDFLVNHRRFHDDILSAIEVMENLLNQ